MASARHLYDFADEQWRELTDWLDKDALLALWPQLYLPPFVRRAWERRHLGLTRAGARQDGPPAR